MNEHRVQGRRLDADVIDGASVTVEDRQQRRQLAGDVLDAVHLGCRTAYVDGHLPAAAHSLVDERIERYPVSGEINSTVADAADALTLVESGGIIDAKSVAGILLASRRI